MLNILKDRRFWAAVLIGAAMTIIGVTISARTAKAGTSWTGCGVGVHGGLAEGSADLGPAHIGITGQTAGAGVLCDYQMGPAIVAGVFAEADKVWGDLEAFGIDWTWSAGGRLGLLPHQSTLVYGLAQWTRIETAGPSLDAWGLGAGIEVKIAKTPLSIDLRYVHLWVEDVFGPSVDVAGDTIRVGLNFKFGPDLTPVNYGDDPPKARKR